MNGWSQFIMHIHALIDHVLIEISVRFVNNRHLLTTPKQFRLLLETMSVQQAPTVHIGYWQKKTALPLGQMGMKKEPYHRQHPNIESKRKIIDGKRVTLQKKIRLLNDNDRFSEKVEFS